VDCDHPEDRFARNKTNPTKKHFLRFDFVVQSIETTGGQRQSTSKLLSQFHNENLIGINSFEDLHIFLLASLSMSLPFDMIRTLMIRTIKVQDSPTIQH
jgi:hypothetical protein